LFVEDQYELLKNRISHDFMQAVLRLVLAFGVFWICARIFSPFATIMLWALILAVTLYPLHLRIQTSLGWSNGLTGSLISCAGLLLLGVPIVLLTLSLIEHGGNLVNQWQDGTLQIIPPDESVKTWPIVGEPLYDTWLAASTNLQDLLMNHGERVLALAKGALGGTTDIISTVGIFLGAVIIAGFMMTYGQSGEAAIGRIASAFVGGDRGREFQALSVATIRSVATGVIGVAAIQALLLGLGYLWAGVPGAAILALVALLLGITQLPAMLVTIPVLAWLWMSGDGSTAMNSVITVYLLIAGLADNILKPVLLGRGVNVPMPVILIGALGGMVGMGLIGLFLGSVVLAVGYQLLWAWVDHDKARTETEATTTSSENPN
jgi:predicted PurR-regulated permease PerM